MVPSVSVRHTEFSFFVGFSFTEARNEFFGRYVLVFYCFPTILTILLNHVFTDRSKNEKIGFNGASHLVKTVEKLPEIKNEHILQKQLNARKQHGDQR